MQGAILAECAQAGCMGPMGVGDGLIMGSMTNRHDVLIVGGGLVGASLAIALDRIGLDVGLSLIHI